MPPRDPHYRPFRVTLWAVYFTLIVLSIGLLIVNVVRHLRAPNRPAPSGVLPTRASLRVCAADLEALHREQNLRAWRLADEVGEGDAIQRWEVWAKEWEQRVGDLGDRCRLDAGDPDPQGFGGRKELAQARDAVLAVHRAYRAQVNRFAQEEAELARSAAGALRQARDAVARPPERG